MKPHDGIELRYVIFEEAWYADALRANGTADPDVVHELCLTVDGCGHDGEGFVRWRRIGDRAVARIEFFCDAWAAFNTVPGFWDTVATLGSHDGPDLGEFRRAVEQIGFVDATPRVNPHAHVEEPAGEPDPRDEALKTIAAGTANAAELARAALAGRTHAEHTR